MLFNFFKCCKGSNDGDLDHLPPARPIELKNTSTKLVTTRLPTSTRAIPELDISPSSSTALAMFGSEAKISVSSCVNTFTSQGEFEDVDLSSHTIFSSPPAVASKVLASPFDDHYEVDYTLANAVPTTNGDEEGSYASSPCSSAPSAIFEQHSRISSFGTCPSPFDDEYEVEQNVEYAPTTPSSSNDYTERAMEYQRVCLLFGPGSVEYNNLQRDHALAVLEGVKPQRNDPLSPTLVQTLAEKMGMNPQC
ncbi:hypothetical protein QM012_002600 [Aureobasidium pullulans]|uniref:Uncharacterized protein n=1 Tax=Aureobasidium pullulans TaxID=5580 RepID=A0ABR0TAL8_AURPU